MISLMIALLLVALLLIVGLFLSFMRFKSSVIREFIEQGHSHNAALDLYDKYNYEINKMYGENLTSKEIAENILKGTENQSNQDSESFEVKIQKYRFYAEKFLGSEIFSHYAIPTFADFSILDGCTPEEAFMHSFLFQRALKAKKFCNDPIMTLAVYRDSMEMMTMFKLWEEKGLIGHDYYVNDMNAIIRVLTIDENQERWLNDVLGELEEFFSKNKADKNIGK